ncbi:hypothetical protein [Calidifontibacter indicus]|uniref:hypothetical protein n=1 Tax=Calidifontibacter indicus TaxID=419650 RepID=UPI003D755664
MNTFHQVGSALGVAVLVAMSASAGGGAVAGLAGRVHPALTGSTGLLVLGLVLLAALVGVPRRTRA